MSRQSAGILLYRRTVGLELFLAHPGGPVWKNKDEGAWTIPKGEFSDEDPLEAARREFQEEIGQPISGNFVELTPIVQKSGKRVFAWAVEGNLDESLIRSNEFELEWPPKSGKWAKFPEVDRAAWFPPDTARRKINPRQVALIDELEQKLAQE